MTSPYEGELDRLRGLLQSDDYSAIGEATVIARRRAAAPTEILLSVYDKFWKKIGEVNDYIDLNASDPRNQVGVLQLTLKGNDPLVPIMRRCRTEVVGLTLEIGGIRLAFTVEDATFRLAEGLKTCVVKAVSLYDYLSYLLVWPNFLAPIFAQVPSRATFFGPIVTCLNTMIAQNALRRQSGWLEFFNNIGSLNFDWRAWFGTALLNPGDPLDALTTPLYVCQVNPLFDSSPLVAFTVRMEPVATVIDNVIKSYGVSVEVTLWLPGDEQPDEYAKLKVPTYVIRVVDRSNVTGPTGTVLDSIVKQLVLVEGSVLGNVLAPLLNPDGVYAPEGVYIAPTIGVDFVVPWTVLIDHPRGPMESFEIVDHHPTGHSIVIGGRSPKWFNDFVNATTSWILDCITIVIGLVGVPSNLFDGLLNDTLLSFQLVQHFPRRNDMGPYGRPEKFIATQAAPYNINALFSFISALWDTRGYRSATVAFRNGYPYSVGRDVFKGAMMSVVENGVMYSDYVENIVITDNRQERTKVIVQIGDGKADEAPVARFQRLITGIQETINTLTLAPN